ncbi:porin, partial [Gammaproteobacteria bacterium]|nr:porin [Gammaproteobacteria bacterium]
MKQNIYKTQKRTTQSNNNFSIFFFLLCMSTINLTADDAEIYGKINLDRLSTEVDSKPSSETNSNASRLGYKAKFKLSSKVNFLIQIENEIDVTDGKADKNKVLKQRNTFIGISGDFGKLFAGTHDTA